MTLGTGKRSYRACLRCRRRKTKCNLDGIGEPKKPPCISCHRSGSECVLVKSKRGGSYRTRRHNKGATGSIEVSVGLDDDTSSVPTGPLLPGHAESVASAHSPEEVGEEDIERATDENLRMELRNPSDALQILAQSGETESNLFSSRLQSPSESGSMANAQTHSYASRQTSSSNTMTADHYGSRMANRKKPAAATVLDDYELIQGGLLHPSVLPELLLIYAQNYHPYCPIVPSYFLEPSAMEKIHRPDYFLLTVLLTIASRDSSNHALTHRYCWDQTQRLLLQVLLMDSWAQTPRTVEGLLLLAEWLPHIQIKQASEVPKSLFSEDRIAWSLIGLAVRQGYLLRLDRAAFRGDANEESKQKEEQKRLIWTFIYLADRQISVRLGQSFWSRGPALSSHFTAKDFPGLSSSPSPGGEDYASVLEATLELTQLLYNIHGILYSSRERTLALVYDGDYARYLDDFLRAATNWHATWRDIQVSHKIKATLLLMYEYICLYVNGFSFQAVLTRTSAPRVPTSHTQKASQQSLMDLFSHGIMSSPDGRYIFDAIRAARNLLNLMNDLDPRHVIRYLPSRYYSYGVYAAVFLHKALVAGAFQSADQRREVTNLASRFISIMKEAPTIESHICHGYSRMLRKLWYRDVRHISSAQNTRTRPVTGRRGRSEYGREGPSTGSESAAILPTSPTARQKGDQQGPTKYGDNPASLDSDFSFNMVGPGNSASALPSIEDYLFGSFLPGVTTIGEQEEVEGDTQGSQMAWIDGFHEFGFGQEAMAPYNFV